MQSIAGTQPVHGRRTAPHPENDKFIRRRDDSKRWFRNETGELERNIRWAEVGDDSYSPSVFPAVRPKKNAMSIWDDAQWPAQSRYPLGKVIAKTKAKKIFMLTDGDIIDLCYRERSYFIPGFRNVTTKEYLCRQLERRAWEKFGGPEGMKKARELRDDRTAGRADATSTVAYVTTAQHVPSPLLRLLDDTDSDADSGSELQEIPSPATAPGAKQSPICIDVPYHSKEGEDVELPGNPLKFKSLGFLDLTLSDSDDEQIVTPQPATQHWTVKESEAIELPD